jgi:NADPH-dependent 2,4-dienoyl-CoA reductase/sulfur reductase-like enzyme
MKTVIVGGVAAGASTAARLRRLDEAAEIVVLERDHYVSFANCGLPYHIGGVIPERESLLLQTPESLARSLALDVRTGQDVVRIDPDAKEVEVTDLQQQRTYREAYDTLVLCPGAHPIRPPIPGADDPRVDVLRNIPDMDLIIAQLEKGATRAVVVGGSYIGLELAEAFRTRGLQTTIVERTARLMPWLDPEMTRILDYHVQTHDVDIRLDTTATAIRRSEDDRLEVHLSDGAPLQADVVVMAAGARPNVELARDAGIEIGPRGGIKVDARMRTSVPDILAAGDAVETSHFLTGEPVLSMLAGPANRQGRIAADTIAGRDTEYRGTQGTAAVKVFDMTAGVTGATEQTLQRAGREYAKVYLHPNGHASYYPGTAPMHLKVLFDPLDGTVLGAQAAGYDGVDKRIDVFAMAIRAGMTVEDLEEVELAYAPPYGSAKDPVNMAGFQAANLLRGDLHLWYAEEWPALPADAVLLDVRSRREHERWNIRGSRLIPLKELRSRLDELPPSAPVFVYCRSGFRSYLAYWSRTPRTSRRRSPAPSRTSEPRPKRQRGGSR